MDLPKSERVIYKRNPLIEVVCQLRYPPILKVNSEPVDFQEAIRDEYPYYEVNKPQLPSDFNKIIQQTGFPFPNEEMGHLFKSEDEKWLLTLTKDFLALKTLDYERYDTFKQQLKKIINIFQEIYKPSFYSRIGFRYQDLIIRSKLDLENVQWAELISPNIASELANSAIKNSIKNIAKNLVLENDYGLVSFRHGFVEVTNQEENNKEIGYLLDADFFTQEKEKTDESIWQPLDYFNESARHLFRWSITDRLHEVMQPQPPESL
ncbi:TIGR04255 family protein [Geminocystis sp. NIES-3709]|uniref:TIGR04255 family protein n=1 Tax=Geminocystis sp. NIES-3709 TaxID=1617448 RepID=UPI0005FC7741|nr:TIGR04255 family protein [Geminocystis sp. NIES-3709]BAQ66091.1 hypothetical protein GM3709_2856 [Geminocystis sp. NIES-3709]